MPAWARGYSELAAMASERLREHRETVENRGRIRTITVPDRHTMLRFTGRCPFCGGTAFNLHLPTVDVEHPHVAYRGSVDCLMCARPVARLVIGGGK